MDGPRTLPCLLDRSDEVEALERAVHSVTAGVGGVVVVEGGPGAGKTRLLGEARALALRAGLRVLSARGGEMEREFPYGGVRQLFEAALLKADGEPWLVGPAAPASSVFAPANTLDADAFATLNGLYWLTANAASEPLVLLVDDLHWLDRPSLGFLEFLVRRLEGIAVLLVIAARPEESDALASLSGSPSTEVLRPAPLSEGAAAKLTEELLGVRPAERFAEACRLATGGNPLLLLELLRTLRTEQIAPDDAHVNTIDHVAPSAVARIVLVRLRRLPGAALVVAHALAVLGTGAAGPVVAELAEVDERAVAQAVASLIDAEIVDPQSPLGFVHPVIRDAIYSELAPDERDRRHARAAQLLRARAAAPDQVGAHLLLSAPRGHSWAVDALCAAAADASHRGAVESAVTFLRRAVAERPGAVDFDVLYRLGMTEAAIDPAAAVAHLRAARRVAPDVQTTARIGELMTRILVFFDPLETIRVARETRAELPAGADDLRAGLLAMERHAARFADADAEADADPTGIPDSPRGRMLMAVHAWDRALSGGTAQECAALAADALGLNEDPPRSSLTRNTIFTAMIASYVLIVADDDRAQAFWDEWSVEAMRVGRAHAMIAGGVWHGMMQFRLGRLAAAEAALRAVMTGPRDWGPGTESVPDHALGTLAEILVERGQLAGAREELDRVPPDLDPLVSEGALRCLNAELCLLAADGRHQEVLDRSDAVMVRLETVVNPAWAPWRSLRADALAHLGRTEEAIALATEELAFARQWGTPAPIGRALTLLGTIQDRVELLEEAVQTTTSRFSRLEHAKALLALGGSVRRSGSPSTARTHLRDAHDLAVLCGADALARRARDELAAAGGRARPNAGTGVGSLTPSERRVAELAAAGRSNREVAQQLFLSTKTVEVHLTNSYRKLEIRRRSELSSALAVPATAP